jgi:hypothetical protein
MLTVKELRKALRGVPDNMPVYIADHDHAEYGTNSIAGLAYVVDQNELNEFEKESLERNPEFKIKGKYFVIRP